MKTYLLLAGLTAGFTATSAYAAFERELIVGWDFSVDSDIGAESELPDWDLGYASSGSLGSIDAYTDSRIAEGRIYFDGTFGSSSLAYGSYDVGVGGANGTTNVNTNIINRALPPQFSASDGGGTAVEALGFDAINGSFVIHVPNTYWGDIQMTYASFQYGTGADAADSVAWEYSTDGINYTTTGVTHTINVGSYQLRTLDLSSITALDFASNIYLRGTLAGATGTNSFNSMAAFDNVQVTGIIPEPSTYAAIAGVLALGLVAYRRRR